MIKYAKIIDNTTGLVDVGLGTDINYYSSIGMSEFNVMMSDIDGKWYLADKCPTKSEAQKLEEAKAAKIAENETKRNVEYITTSIGQLKTQTPLGDLKTAIPLFDKIAAANGGLPAGAVRLYDSEGNVTLSPALTLEQYQALTVEVAMAYVAIDAKSTAYTQAILQAQNMDELEAIVIDYTASAQQEEAEGEEEAPSATGAGTTGSVL